MFRCAAIACCIALVCCSQKGISQTKTIETLKGAVAIAATNAEKLRAIFLLCDQGYTLHPDTLIKYAEEGKKIAIQQKNLHDEVQSMFYISGALTTKGLIDSSLNLANKCLSTLDGKIDDPVLSANLYNQKGRCFMRKNQYKEAIDMGYHVINDAEKGRDTLLAIKGKTLIGWAYLEMNQINEALKWHLNAMRTTTDTTILKKYGILFANIALNYNGLGKTDSGFYYIKKAVDYSRSAENLFALSNSLAIEAQLYVRAGLGNQAEAPLKEVVEIRKLIGDPFYIVSDMAQLALYYAHFGQPQKGIALCNDGIAIANKYKLATKLFFLYSSLAENFKAAGNRIRQAETLEKIIALKDSVYQNNLAGALAEMQAKYDVQRKENIIIQQKLDIVSKNFQLFGTFMLVLLGVVISIILFRKYRRRQKLILQTMRLEEQRRATDAVQKAEENERKRIAADLHDNMGAYASAISANVDELLLGRKADHSILSSMKNNATEIMSNLRDTIWVLNKDEIFITGISDRFKNYVQKIRDAYPGINIQIKESITNNVSLSPENALNMLRIMQEAFHNAIKHSKCSNITIEIISNGTVQVKITDDGTGILISADDVMGHGIHNMSIRAETSGWKLRIDRLQPQGTTVELNA